MATPVIVDAHMHLYGSRAAGERAKDGYEIWEYGEPPVRVPLSRYGGDLDDAVEAMAHAGYDRAVVVNLFAVDLAREEAIAALPLELKSRDRERALAEIEGTMGDRLRAFNRWACELLADKPQFTPFVSMDPWALPPDEGVAHLRDLVQHHGARGIKLHPVLQRFAVNDPRMHPIYRACIELDITVLSHSGPARGSDQYGEPRAFAEVLGVFPDLRLVVAHMGGGSWRQTVDLARAFPTTYFDCSEIIEWTSGPLAPTEEALARLIRDVGSERVMLGTDFPWYDLDRTADRVMALPLLSREEKEGILGANAMRILRL